MCVEAPAGPWQSECVEMQVNHSTYKIKEVVPVFASRLASAAASEPGTGPYVREDKSMNGVCSRWVRHWKLMSTRKVVRIG
jgi:hypothetical protein